MEKINEFFDYVKERFSNPLFYSFIISWIFCNWEVVVALLWYDSADSSIGHLSLINYIDSKTNNFNSIIYPLGFALLYTTLSPVLKNLISALQTWNSKWGEDWNLSILKGSMISIDKYLSFKSEYEKRSSELEKAISSESVTLEKLEQTKTALLEGRNQQNHLKQELSEAKAHIQNYNNTNILSGRWIRVIETAAGVVRENIEIQNNNLYVYQGNSREQKYSIYDFYYDSNSKVTHFTLFYSNTPNLGFFAFNRLVHRHKGFSGVEYGTNYLAEVSYSKDEEFEDDFLEEDGNDQETTNRDFWLKKGTDETVRIVDEILELINSIKPGYNLKYNKIYIGMTYGDQVNNFVIYKPKKEYTRLELHIPKSSEVDKLIKDSGLKEMDYDERWGRYRIRLNKGDVQKYSNVLTNLLSIAERN